MKKILIILALTLGFMVGAFADAWSVSVGTNSVVIVPSVTASASAWVSNTVYSAGDYITTSSARKYWTPTGGTSTNEPTAFPGVTTGADSVTWVDVQKVNRTIIICADSTTAIYCNDNAAAVSGTGLILDDLRPAVTYVNYRGDVRAVTASGTATITVKSR